MLGLGYEALTGIVTSIMAIVTFGYKSLDNRFKTLEKAHIDQELRIQKSPSPTEVKEIITDKIAPLNVLLVEIKDDIQDIKQDMRHLNNGQK